MTRKTTRTNRALVRRRLFPHQEEGAFVYTRRQPHPAFLMDMRLGKTLTMIRWVKSLPEVRSILIIAPPTVLKTWADELTLERERFLIAYGVPLQRRLEACASAYYGEEGRTWVLMSYAAVRITPQITAMKWGVVGLDESTAIANPQAQITKISLRGFREAQHRTILTGLINPEDDLQVVCQMLFLDGKFMGCKDYWEFRAKHYDPPSWGYEWFPRKGVRQRIRDTIRRRCFVRTKADVGLFLEKSYSTRRVEMNVEQKRLYKQIEKEFAFQIGPLEWSDTIFATTAHLWLCRLAGGFSPEGNRLVSSAKIVELLGLLEGDLKKEQVIVWFRFREELQAVRQALEKARISYTYLIGGMARRERWRRLESFQRGSSRVLLVTVKVAKYGIDASGASTAIYYSNEYSNEDRSQSEERIIHPQNKGPYLFIDLQTAGTVDEEIVPLLQEKRFKARSLVIKFKEMFNKRRQTK